ncbi:MAG: hypothetical protein AAF387_16410 [Pseudomonadota bacterium]
MKPKVTKQCINPKRPAVKLILLFILCIPFTQICAQQVDPAQLQQALARAQGLLRQLAQQKGALEAEKAKMQAELAGIERKLKREQNANTDLEAELASSQRETGRITGSLNATKSRLDRVENRLKEIVGKYKALDASNTATLQEKADLETELADTQQQLADANQKNEEMYQANQELLNKFINKGPWDSMLQLEPFTGIKQVEIENIEQEYQFRLEDARLLDGELAQ